jgi:hypothetical protein
MSKKSACTISVEPTFAPSITGQGRRQPDDARRCERRRHQSRRGAALQQGRDGEPEGGRAEPFQTSLTGRSKARMAGRNGRFGSVRRGPAKVGVRTHSSSSLSRCSDVYRGGLTRILQHAPSTD